jgi:hypothetical protein
MEFNWSIVGWIAGLVFVYIFGLYEGRGQGYKKRKAEEANEKKDVAEPRPVTVKVDDPGLLRIRNENGGLTLDLDGTRLEPSALTAEQRKRLIEMVTMMRPWLEGKPATAPTLVTAPPSQPRPAAAASQSAASAPLPPVPQPTSAKKSETPTAPAATIANDDRPAAPAGSIVNQIDAILQAHLVGTPLAERGVFLTQSPEGGVIVYVGLSKYVGVEDVPDEEVKAAIRAAIKEWENKYTPGI